MNMEKPTPGNIWCYKQNKVSYIVDDIINKYPEIDKDFLYETLYKYGVFKWFAVRRDLIKLKNSWRKMLAGWNYRKKDKKEKGRHWMLAYCSQEIRRLCHSDRWTVQDNDRRAAEWFNKLNDKNKTGLYFYDKKIWRENIDLKKEEM